MKLFSGILTIVIILFSFVGCSKFVPEEPPDKSISELEIDTSSHEEQSSTYTAVNQLGISVFQKVCDKNSDNHIISPASLATALAILAKGADGKTKQELIRVINPKGVSEEQINSDYNKMMDYIANIGYEEEGNKTTFMEMSDSIWTCRNMKIEKSFADISKEYFNADIKSVDFGEESSMEEINSWISNKTHGKIKDYLNQIDPMTVMYIFNTLYFNAKWENQFAKEETKKEDFYLSKNKSVQVDMMNGEHFINYYEDESVKAGKLPYYGCSMVAILPKGDMDKYLRDLNTDSINKILISMEYTKTKIKLPKFRYESQYNLNDYLETLGISDAFDAEKADFSKIAKRQELINLYVGEVSQKCFISLDEEGTDAAALTSVALCGGLPPKVNNPPELYLNRPFIYLIRDDITGIIWFIGRVENPMN